MARGCRCGQRNVMALESRVRVGYVGVRGIDSVQRQYLLRQWEWAMRHKHEIYAKQQSYT